MCVCDGKYISETQNWKQKRKREKTEFIKFWNGKGENLKRKISASIHVVFKSFIHASIYPSLCYPSIYSVTEPIPTPRTLWPADLVQSYLITKLVLWNSYIIKQQSYCEVDNMYHPTFIIFQHMTIVQVCNTDHTIAAIHE